MIPPLLELFRKFIRFGSLRLPYWNHPNEPKSETSSILGTVPMASLWGSSTKWSTRWLNWNLHIILGLKGSRQKYVSCHIRIYNICALHIQRLWHLKGGGMLWQLGCRGMYWPIQVTVIVIIIIMLLVTKIVRIQVLNCQNCNQCLKCHKSPRLSLQSSKLWKQWSTKSCQNCLSLILLLTSLETNFTKTFRRSYLLRWVCPISKKLDFFRRISKIWQILSQHWRWGWWRWQARKSGHLDLQAKYPSSSSSSSSSSMQTSSSSSASSSPVLNSHTAPCPRCDHDNDHVQGGSHHGSYLEHWVSDLGGQGAFIVIVIVIVIVTHVISGDGKSAEEQHLDKHCHSLGAA